MKNSKLPLSVRVFKARKYFLDKKSNLKYNAKRIKENHTIGQMIKATRKLIKKMLRNLKNNRDNWMDRVGADEGFLIDS